MSGSIGRFVVAAARFIVMQFIINHNEEKKLAKLFFYEKRVIFADAIVLQDPN